VLALRPPGRPALALQRPEEESGTRAFSTDVHKAPPTTALARAPACARLQAPVLGARKASRAINDAAGDQGLIRTRLCVGPRLLARKR
jgi:hypothetical protein